MWQNHPLPSSESGSQKCVAWPTEWFKLKIHSGALVSAVFTVLFLTRRAFFFFFKLCACLVLFHQRNKCHSSRSTLSLSLSLPLPLPLSLTDVSTLFQEAPSVLNKLVGIPELYILYWFTECFCYWSVMVTVLILAMIMFIESVHIMENIVEWKCTRSRITISCLE